MESVGKSGEVDHAPSDDDRDDDHDHHDEDHDDDLEILVFLSFLNSDPPWTWCYSQNWVGWTSNSIHFHGLT